VNTQMLTTRIMHTCLVWCVNVLASACVRAHIDQNKNSWKQIRVNTEVLSTRMLYTCFVRCVGVCGVRVSGIRWTKPGGKKSSEQ
jgi:hypothetical protein